MCLIAKNTKPFKSSILKNKLSHYDKTDPKNLKLPTFIEDIDEELLYDLIPHFVEKYRAKQYKLKNREELEDEKDWNDLEILLLVKFYKNHWSFMIDDEYDFFPHFVFTYNIEPLKKEIDKLISYLHDRITVDDTKDELENRFKYSSLEVTYLLHYFVIAHPDYKEKE